MSDLTLDLWACLPLDRMSVRTKVTAHQKHVSKEVLKQNLKKQTLQLLVGDSIHNTFFSS